MTWIESGSGSLTVITNMVGVRTLQDQVTTAMTNCPDTLALLSLSLQLTLHLKCLVTWTLRYVLFIELYFSRPLE